MKILKIENKGDLYTVTFKPNWIEKLFGMVIHERIYKDNNREFVLGGHVYITQDGEKLDCFNWIGMDIDKWRRKF